MKNIKSLWQFFWGKLYIWHSFELSLSIFTIDDKQIFVAEYGQMSKKQSSHLVTLVTKPRVRNCNRDRPKSAKSASISMTANEK